MEAIIKIEVLQIGSINYVPTKALVDAFILI